MVPEVARPVAAASGDGAVGPVDTSRPKELFLVARFRNPEETLDASSTLSATPLSLALSALALTEEGKGISSLDLRQPVDIAAALPPGAAFAGSAEDDHPEPIVGFTFGIVDVERAMGALPNGWTARPWRSGLRVVGEGGLVCEVPTRGHVAARVFCASSDEASRALGGWMTRTLITEPAPPVDARFTFLAAPIRAQIHALIDSELREELGDSRDALAGVGVTDPELVAVPALLVDELEALAEDSDQLELDVDLDGAGKTATAKTTVRFRSTTGWVARVLSDPAERRGPPPAMFWRAPKDADSASWAMSASPRHFAGIRRVIDKSVRAATSLAQLSPDESNALAGAVSGFPSTSGTWFAAQGSIPWKPPARGNATPQNAIADLKDRARAYVGWGLVGVETPVKPWIEWFSQLEAAWKKGVVIAKREMKGSSDLDEIPDFKIVRNPGGYPAGTVAIDVTGKFDSKLAWEMSPRVVAPVDGVKPEHPAGKPLKGSATLRIVAVPDGPGAIVGWSLDDASLKAHVRAALRDAPASGTIAARTDLERLRRDGTGGGYFSLASWTEMFTQIAADEDPQLAEVAKIVTQLPNKAATPILTFADGTTGNTPTLVFEAMIQEGTFDDIRELTKISMAKGLGQILGGGEKSAEPAVVVPAPIVAPPKPSKRP